MGAVPALLFCAVTASFRNVVTCKYLLENLPVCELAAACFRKRSFIMLLALGFRNILSWISGGDVFVLIV